MTRRRPKCGIDGQTTGARFDGKFSRDVSGVCGPFPSLDLWRGLKPIEFQVMTPGGQHGLFELVETGFGGWEHLLPLCLMEFFKRFSELLACHGIFWKLAIRKDLQVSIRLLLVGRFFEGRRILVVQEPFSEPSINRLPAGLIVVVAEIKADKVKFVAGLEQFVDVSNGRTFDLEGGFGPIASSGDKNLRPRSRSGSDFHV